MTTSSEPFVISGEDADRVTPLAMHDLRVATWTRLGGAAVRGDEITETTLDRLADEARVAAEAQGYAAGWARGVREAREAAEQERQLLALQEEQRAQLRDQEHAAAVAALHAVAASLQVRTEEMLRAIEDQAAGLALAVTEAALGLAVEQVEADDVVRRALAEVEPGTSARVRVHPEVARTGTAHRGTSSVTLVSDASLSRADAVVELDDHALDLRVDRALHRVRVALLGDQA